MMMPITWTLGIGLSILVILGFANGNSFVTLGQQGYDNLLVQISDDVPSVNCLEIISNLQTVFEEASSALCKSLDNRTFFGNVTIMIPNHWNGNCLKDVDYSITWPRTYTADVYLSGDHPVFGNQPFSLHYGGCGVGGLPIRLPLGFLTGPTRGAGMVHEWFHYRYGVFDESGLNGDPLYPNGYKISQPEAPFLPTSCTNVPLKGQWMGNEWQNGDNNGNVTSSIMFSTSLENIYRPCTRDNHLKAPPTKQNWMCGGRSISEIVNEHRDFEGFNQTKTCTKTHFNVVTNPHRGYHIILDVSSAMGASTKFLESAAFALSHFIWFLPDETIVSIDTFSSTYAQLQTPIGLNLATKNAILNSLNNLRADTGNSDGLNFALNNAIRMFRSGSEIILLTATETVPNGFNSLVNDFHRNLIAPHILALSVSTCNVLSTLARDGWLHFIPSWITTPELGLQGRNPRTWMVDTLHSIYSRTRKYRAKVEEKTLGLIDGWNNGTFQLDSTGTKLIFAFLNLDDGFNMTFINGFLRNDQLDEQCPIVKRNTVVALYTADCKISTFQEGLWSYYIQIEGHSMVRIDSWFEGHSAVRVESWTSTFQNNPIDWTSEHVVIYALVTQQQKVVSGVSPVVHVFGNNSTGNITVSLKESDPSDITNGDGIYSVILTNMPRNSISFSYVVEIIDGSGTVDSGKYDGHPMAGSFIPVSQPTPLPTTFNRYVYGGSFLLSQSYDGRDVLPPDRITDLKINDFNSNNASVELIWTGPKDDYGASLLLAKRHIIAGEDDLVPGKELVYFDGDVQPSPGSLNHMTLVIAVSTANQSRNIYYRVYALDASSNQGKSSNIATLFVPAAPDVGPLGPEDRILPPALFWFLIGLGCLCLILIAVIVGVCICRKRENKKREEMGAEWVQIGETTIGTMKTPDKKNDLQEKAEIPDFNSGMTSPAFLRRRSSPEFFSSKWSDGGCSTGTEIYQQPHVISTSARIETSKNSQNESIDSDSELSLRRTIPSYSFGANNWDTVSSLPTIAAYTGPKKIPPRPPPRQYFPYSSDSLNESRSANNANMNQLRTENTPLASSPSYFASQLRKEDISYLHEQGSPITYSMRTLTSASNSSMGKFGIILGGDSEASLV